MRITSKIVIALLFILILSNVALASPEIMPISKIKPGMKGVGKTVLRGTKIENFNVEIVSILKDQHPKQDLILVKTSGDVIERTGGIASGMSGSPVYIDGKLIGAIGYGWQMANHKIGMVTPIKNMMDLFTLNPKEEKENKDLKLSTPVKIGQTEYNKIQFTSHPERVDAKDVLVATPVSTPLLVNGLQGRAKERLAKSLDNYDVVPVKGGGLMNKKLATDLKPGSAVAAQLVRGDINVSAVGTLTYLDQDKFLAFGHPFLSKGSSNYLLSAAYIHQMITSIKMPFKIGSAGELKGIVTQDRTAGIAGKLGKYPNVIPLEVNVIDKNLNIEEKYNVQIIQNQNLLRKLASSVILQAIDSTIDRKGAGTAKVGLEVMVDNVSNKIVKRDNLYYSSSDIAAVSLSDFLQGLDVITNNPFRKVNIANIKFDVVIEKSPKVALVEKVTLDKEKVKPGEKVTAEITLRPYRKEVIKKKVTFEVPKDTAAGQLEFYISSGQEANLKQNASQQDQPSSQTNNIKNLQQLIKLYEEQKENNQLVVELLPPYTPPDMQNGEVPENDSTQPLAEEVINTNYVLEGSVMEKVQVIKEQKEKNKK